MYISTSRSCRWVLLLVKFFVKPGCYERKRGPPPTFFLPASVKKGAVEVFGKNKVGGKKGIYLGGGETNIFVDMYERNL